MSIAKELKVRHPDNKFILIPSILFLVTTLTILWLTSSFTTSIISGLTVLLVSVLTCIFHVYRSTLEAIKYQDKRNQSLLNIHRMINTSDPLPSMAGWASFPALIEVILMEASRKKDTHVFEIGSGSSTIILSYLFNQKKAGRITSIDHDEVFGNKTRTELDDRGLSEFADVFICPLSKQRVLDGEYNWYDISNMNIEDPIDIVIVDGPPEKTQKNARFPALPLLIDKLSDSAVIILDDSARKEEKEIVRMWLKEYPEFEHQYIDSEKGISVLRRG
jgi:predicted O-methyltransferase YrrM